MRLEVFRHLWGVSEPWEETLPRFSQAGYAGIETGVPPPEQRQRFNELRAQYGLDYIAQIFTEGQTVEDHLDSFGRQLREAAEVSPRVINCHGGRDAFTEQESARFYEGALALEAETGAAVAHETHRGRIFYNPWVTSRMLERFPELRLCCDLSHWVCVCERLLDGMLDVVDQCADRCLHLHARVGYEEGPQVPDPRAPEYRRHLDAHEEWWRRIWQAQRARGREVTTLTPEFGPPGYLHTLPHTNMPVADLGQICDWQAQRQKDNFAAWRKTG